VTAYLEFAELQALNRKPMTMVDWISKLDDFLKLSDREILTNAGKISHDAAREKAEAEFAVYKKRQAALPQPVDEHFARSLDELKTLESQAKEAMKKAAGHSEPKQKAAKKPKGKKRSDD
ncbi:MAG: RhuM family protein, partial [Planctomyces sp.]